MFRKKNRNKKRSRAMLSAYSIIMILIVALGILSHVLPKAKYTAVKPEAESSEEVQAEAPTEGEKVVPAAAGGAVVEGQAAGPEPETEPAVVSTETTSGTAASGVATNGVTAGEAATGAATNDGTVAGTTNGTAAGTTNGVTGDVATTEAKPETPPTKPEGVPEAKEASAKEAPAKEAEEKPEEAKTYDSKDDCEKENEECVIVDGSGVVGAELYQILMAPILGFEDAIDVCIFVMILGGFLAIVAKTKALETGIKLLVKKLHGREYILILILMLLFSVFGTTYGFLEESVGFYVLIAATMFAAGMDPLVGVATILLGAGSGVLGSTINPFATGVAVSAMKDAGIEYNQGMIILIATVLWLTTLAISAFFVIKYAKKVQRDKGSTFLSLREQAAAKKKYGKYLDDNNEIIKLTGQQIATLVVFAITFIVMIVGFIPWGEFGVTFFDSWTGWLTGASLGNWWFYEAALWFLLMSILIAIINRQGEHGFIDTFIDGADDMVGVVLVIAVARGASVLMAQTSLDNFIVYNASNLLATLPEMAFVPLNYILHIVLSILVPSSSGLATLSTPIITPVAANLGYSTDVAAMTIVAANGLVNLITPTCGAIMGGLALAKVDYPTWFKWGIRVVAVIAIVNIVVLCLFSL